MRDVVKNWAKAACLRWADGGGMDASMIHRMGQQYRQTLRRVKADKICIYTII